LTGGVVKGEGVGHNENRIPYNNALTRVLMRKAHTSMPTRIVTMRGGSLRQFQAAIGAASTPQTIRPPKKYPLQRKHFCRKGCNSYELFFVRSSGWAMKTSFRPQQLIVFSAFVLILILFSIQFLDAILALHIKQKLHSIPFLNKSFSNIPNLLPLTVLTGTAAMWIIFFRVQYSGSSRHASFLKLAAIAVPAAFLLKMLLQYIFGRTNIKVWLASGKPLEFAWFTPLSQHPVFPSGHMTVFSSFFVTVFIYYPRCRPIAAIALIALASALIFTNYHFLGDIIAGFFCGILVTALVEKLLSNTSAI